MRLLKTAVAAFLLFSAASDAFAEKKTMIYNFEGRSTIIRDRKTILPEPDFLIEEGDLIQTQADAQMDLAVNYTLGVRLMAETECLFVKTEESETILKLLRGKALFNVRPIYESANYHVNTPLAIVTVEGTPFSPTGTQFYIAIGSKKQKGLTVYAMKKGRMRVKIKRSSSVVRLLEGQALEVNEETFISPARNIAETEIEAMYAVNAVPIT